LMSFKRWTNIASPLDLNSSKSIDQINEFTIETIKESKQLSLTNSFRFN
jgi:hypothetical protein